MDRRDRCRGSRSLHRPRRRGDGPTTSGTSMSAIPSAPQARGWTPDRWVDPVQQSIGPAGAGMDRSACGHGICSIDRPRRRGDGPRVVLPGDVQGESAPQARGWTACRSAGRRPGGIGPAGAGMDPTGHAAYAANCNRPRRRGDGPTSGCSCSLSIRSALQARGWTNHVGYLDVGDSIGPAGAGMDPRSLGRPSAAEHRPRRRRDGPLPAECPGSWYTSAPQARGWTVLMGDLLVGNGSGATASPRRGRRGSSSRG